MSPDGARTVAGSDDEKLYVFNRTTLVASGAPMAGDATLRGVAVTDDGRYAGVGGTWFTLHNLSAVDPIRPIYIDTTPSQVRAVAFSADGRYVAYGGWNNVEANRQGAAPTTYMAVYDVRLGQRVFTHRIAYPAGATAELRHLSISSDGNKIVAGTWARHVLYYVRSDPNSTTWQLRDDIELRERVYWTAMDPADSVVVVGEQTGLVQLYALGESALTLLWEKRRMEDGISGGPRTVGISADGRYVTATTRGGCGADDGGRFTVWSRDGELVFSASTAAVDLNCTGTSPSAESWFGAIAESGMRLAFAGWGGSAYFYRLESP
jgi:WD40 repeat protein